jgi:N-formylglutamate amidohydrolase
MTDVYSLHVGDLPLLVSVPHDGRQVPAEIRAAMTRAALELPDTDWHVSTLYDFVPELGASMITANYSRYVVDLNRPPDDARLYEGKPGTGLCPQTTFAGEPLYRNADAIDTTEVAARVEQYWHPYHERLQEVLDELRGRHGYALLWDAHSIPSRVPTLFDGELPILNLGTWDDRSCDARISDVLFAVADSSDYAAVKNGRFKGGYITRHYGDPVSRVNAVQLELAQRAYMDEASYDYSPERAGRLRRTLHRLLETFLREAVIQ